MIQIFISTAFLCSIRKEIWKNQDGRRASTLFSEVLYFFPDGTRNTQISVSSILVSPWIIATATARTQI